MHYDKKLIVYETPSAHSYLSQENNKNKNYALEFTDDLII